MIHDLRHPTIVIAGAFNPHIFTPQWIANVLFQIPEGEEVKGVMVTDLVAQVMRAYIGNIGVQAEGHRLSIFVDSTDAADWTLAEATVARVCEALPHTPVQGFGINFRFFDNDFDPQIATLLRPSDKPETLGQVTEYSATAKIKHDDQTELNLTRSVNEEMFAVQFNYHADRHSMADVAQLIEGRVAKFRQISLEALEVLYQIDPQTIQSQKSLNENLVEG